MPPLMKLIRQLGFLHLGWPADKREVDDEKLLHLFRNRAELKKAYSGVQDELQRLRDRIKQQEGATARVQEMLQGLEARLSAPETAYPTLVFYQLRELWALGRTVLTQFTAELAEQQEERERRAFLADYNRRQFDRRQGIDANLRQAEGRASDARNAVTEVEQRMQSLRAFWHYFKRRALRQKLQEANLQALLCAQDLDGARTARAQLDAEAAPEFGGLSIEARRAINLAAVGLRTDPVRPAGAHGPGGAGARGGGTARATAR
jgi:chromosome segregation ATPase